MELIDMPWFIWVGIVVLINSLIGAAVWSWIDDDAERLYNWWSNPPRGGTLHTLVFILLQFLILMCWPVCLFFVGWDKEKEK